MLITPTIDKLNALALTGMARALLDQREHPDYAALSFEERLGLLVDREMQDRDNRRLARHLKAARLRSDAVIEDLDLRGPRGLDRATVLGLAEGHWVTAHRNVLVTGPTGVGKTFLACALAQAAIRRGHTALYLRVPRLLDELVLARADGRLPRLMAAWAKVDVLVLDEAAAGAGSTGGRPAGGDRGSRGPPLDHRHQPAAGRPLARGPRRAHRRRRDPGPPRPQRLSAGAQGRLAPPGDEGCRWPSRGRTGPGRGARAGSAHHGRRARLPADHREEVTKRG
jgi:hypothetical protein